MAAVAHDPGSGCGLAPRWWCTALDGGGVGEYTSIDAWGISYDNWKLGISYYDRINRALKLRMTTCVDGNCTNKITTIDRPQYSGIYNGLYSSLKYLADGTPYIAYHRINESNHDSLRITHPVLSGGNCGWGDEAGKWQCDRIDEGFGLGQYVTLDVSWNNGLYIAYYDEYHGNLKYANYVGLNGDCSDNKWVCITVDGTDGSDVGKHAVLKAPQKEGAPLRIAYYDDTHNTLKFYNSGLGTPMVVDHLGDIERPDIGISMDIDQDGLAAIAYQQFYTWNPAVLRIARPFLAFNDGSYGNCGDLLGGQHYWRCRTLDSRSETIREAGFISMAFDSRGLAMIVYTENDVSHDATSLKVTTRYIFIPTCLSC